MGALLEAGGEQQLVQRIAHERNLARVRELADEPRLLAWLDAAGLTVAEAAAIQPSYCFIKKSQCFCGRFSGSAHGVVEGQIVSSSNFDSLVRVTATHDQVGVIQVGDLFMSEVAGTGEVIASLSGPIAGVRAEDGGLLSVDGGLIALDSVTLSADGHVACQNAEIRDTPKLTSSQLVQVAEAPNCEQALVAIDSSWDDSICGPLGGCGCRASTEPTPATVLLALAASVIALRSRRRR
ncbi:MAG: hypothetical protein JST54_34520 [Deltaproteobacteria bacterium]|nr:hypothetical protein [Deltaproteobacteria bacterium]